MKLLYYLACIGSPNFYLKLNVVNHNLRYLYDQIKEPFDLCINLYDTTSEAKTTLEKLVQSHPYVTLVYVYQTKGVLTQLFLNNPYNSKVIHYDYCLFMLDDVQFKHVNFYEWIDTKTKYSIQIMSPRVDGSTHKFMNNQTGLTFNNFLEVYCLLLTPQDFDLFLSLQTEDNCWMWGADVLFGYYNISAGVDHRFTVEHLLPSQSKKQEAWDLHIQYFRDKQLPYTTFHDVVKHYRPIRNRISL